MDINLSKWEITRNVASVGGRLRVQFVAASGEKLKSRYDVVLYLAKNPHIDLQPENFSFKVEIEQQTDLGVGTSSEETGDGTTPLDPPGEAFVSDEASVGGTKRAGVMMEMSQTEEKRLKLDGEFDEKVLRITGKSGSDPCEKYREVLTQLQELRLKNSNKSSTLSSSSVTALKNLLTDVKLGDDPVQLIKELCKNEDIFDALESVLHTSVETEIELYSIKDLKSVTMTFPVDQRSNFYCAVIEEAIEKMPRLLNLIISIVDTDSESLAPSFAIRIANLICEILSCKDRRHSALSKLNTLHLMFQKSSVANLKTFSQKGFCTGHTEATRLVEEIAELAEFFKSSQYKEDLGMQLTIDNVDYVMKGKLEHWILAFSRMDPIHTHGLSNLEPSFDLKSATHEIVYLVEEETEYLSKCARVVLAKKLFDMNVGFSNILKHIPYKPLHKFTEMLEKQEIFVEALEPLNEMEHQGKGISLRIALHFIPCDVCGIKLKSQSISMCHIRVFHFNVFIRVMERM